MSAKVPTAAVGIPPTCGSNPVRSTTFSSPRAWPDNQPTRSYASASISTQCEY